MKFSACKWYHVNQVNFWCICIWPKCYVYDEIFLFILRFLIFWLVKLEICRSYKKSSYVLSFFSLNANSADFFLVFLFLFFFLGFFFFFFFFFFFSGLSVYWYFYVTIIKNGLPSYLFIWVISVKFEWRDWRPWIISIICRTRNVLLNRGML